jgi:hypothetical protein
MALFTVQPGTFWLHDRASLMASATAFERDSRTVKQVTIPVHGANGNLMVSTTNRSQRPVPLETTPQGAPSCTAAPKRPMVGVQPTPGLGRCVQQRRACATGVQPRQRRPQRRHPAAVGGRCVTAASSTVTHLSDLL